MNMINYYIHELFLLRFTCLKFTRRLYYPQELQHRKTIHNFQRAFVKMNRNDLKTTQNIVRVSPYVRGYPYIVLPPFDPLIKCR